MENIFRILGLVCIAIVVLLSIYTHWYVNKKTSKSIENVEKAEKLVVKGSLVRLILIILAVAFLLASEVL